MADMTLEGSQSVLDATGDGQAHMCRNRDEAIAWIEARRVDDIQSIVGPWIINQDISSEYHQYTFDTLNLSMNSNKYVDNIGLLIFNLHIFFVVVRWKNGKKAKAPYTIVTTNKEWFSWCGIQYWEQQRTLQNKFNYIIELHQNS